MVHTLARQRDQLGLCLECELAHADEVLRDLCQALLVLVHQELGPVGEVLVQLLQCLGIILAQPDLLPHVLGRMSPLNRLQSIRRHFAPVMVQGTSP